MSSQNAAGGKVRPGLKSGRSNEFTLVMPLKPGGAERMRKNVADTHKMPESMMNRIGTLHESRFVIFDNDTRLLFATTFDGDWDSYIDDFASLIPDIMDRRFEEIEGYPGIRSPDIKDLIVKHPSLCIELLQGLPRRISTRCVEGIENQGRIRRPSRLGY